MHARCCSGTESDIEIDALVKNRLESDLIWMKLRIVSVLIYFFIRIILIYGVDRLCVSNWLL